MNTAPSTTPRIGRVVPFGTCMVCGQRYADARLLAQISERNLLINCNGPSVTIIDQQGRTWKGSDLIELLHQIIH